VKVLRCLFGGISVPWACLNDLASFVRRLCPHVEMDMVLAPHADCQSPAVCVPVTTVLRCRKRKASSNPQHSHVKHPEPHPLGRHSLRFRKRGEGLPRLKWHQPFGAAPYKTGSPLFIMCYQLRGGPRLPLLLLVDRGCSLSFNLLDLCPHPHFLQRKSGRKIYCSTDASPTRKRRWCVVISADLPLPLPHP
jgi:hypothetical protein